MLLHWELKGLSIAALGSGQVLVGPHQPQAASQPTQRQDQHFHLCNVLEHCWMCMECQRDVNGTFGSPGLCECRVGLARLSQQLLLWGLWLSLLPCEQFIPVLTASY